MQASVVARELEISFDEVLQATGGFNSQRLLGEGMQGSVFAGLLTDGTEVAVKRLSVEVTDEKAFETEVSIGARCRHPNLVILMGFARRGPVRCLVYERLTGGDVSARLFGHGAAMTAQHRLDVALDIACGLSSLHHSTPKVFHRDIKSANILLDKHGTAKVADFGLSCLARRGPGGVAVAQISGTVGYADPKYIESGVVTESTEVYSFGIVLLELLTARPAAVQDPRDQRHYDYLVNRLAFDVRNVLSLLDPRAQWPPHLSAALSVLALRCIGPPEAGRPAFPEIVAELRSLQRCGEASPQPVQACPSPNAALLASPSPCRNVGQVATVYSSRRSFGRSASPVGGVCGLMYPSSIAVVPGVPNGRDTTRSANDQTLGPAYGNVAARNRMGRDRSTPAQWASGRREASPPRTVDTASQQRVRASERPQHAVRCTGAVPLQTVCAEELSPPVPSWQWNPDTGPDPSCKQSLYPGERTPSRPGGSRIPAPSVPSKRWSSPPQREPNASGTATTSRSAQPSPPPGGRVNRSPRCMQSVGIRVSSNRPVIQSSPGPSLISRSPSPQLRASRSPSPPLRGSRSPSPCARNSNQFDTLASLCCTDTRSSRAGNESGVADALCPASPRRCSVPVRSSQGGVLEAGFRWDQPPPHAEEVPVVEADFESMIAQAMNDSQQSYRLDEQRRLREEEADFAAAVQASLKPEGESAGARHDRPAPRLRFEGPEDELDEE